MGVGMGPPGASTAARKSTVRPPPLTSSSRPNMARSQTATPTLNGRASPADSLIASNSMRSPARSVNGGPATTTNAKRKDRDFDQMSGEETNINVVVRCRGRNDREVRENSGVVVSTDGVKGQKVDLSMGPSALSNKTYHFDKVFSPAADQEMLFSEVVSPMLDEVLSGFNCTIFAYGQTGTGKTYTMSGDITDQQPLPDAAGIIPRILYALFGRLGDDDSEPETSVKCSFIELYNEELRDLLSLDDMTKLKIYDDNSKKGPTSTLIQGMEETHITSASKGLDLLKSGSYKRQVAATKCNDLSSRSHTIFTLTIYRKRTSDSGDDYISAGKLNLVDLAGSENIQRSGAENKRAAEAGLINKSLLTLGRVINALVERSPHVPYRESKLTRLLQDSLGGRTKTLIIATLSPARSNLEETISTLDYAFRAKNIRNKPQLNQMISKNTLLKDFTIEIEKLKTELVASRQRNGVWMSQETFEEGKIEKESQRILANEQRDKIETMEINLRNKVQELFSLTNSFNRTKKDNETARTTVELTKGLLDKTEIVLAHTRKSLAEETYLRKAHQETEEKLITVGQELLNTLETTKTDVDGLHSGLRRRSDLQLLNRQKWSSQQSKVVDVTSLVDEKLENLRRRQELLASQLTGRVQSYINDELDSVNHARVLLQSKTDSFQNSETEVQTHTDHARKEMDAVLEGITSLREDVKTKVGAGLGDLSAATRRVSAGIASELDAFHAQLHGSYASLGREFKTIFDDVIKRMNEQSAEMNELRKQMTSANAALAEASQQSHRDLETVLEKERETAAAERQQLLSQIGSIVAATAEAQETRLQNHLGGSSERVQTLQEDHRHAQHHWDRGMDEWSGHNAQLVESCVRWRESVKSKIKSDWSSANETSLKIKQTADTVGGETNRIVASQMSHLDVQLAALDGITDRVRQQNEMHNSKHASSISLLMADVQESYGTINAQLETSSTRTTQLQSLLTEHESNTARTAVELAVEGSARQMLSNLREDSMASELMDYVPTGQTPARTTYAHAAALPRTMSHEEMLERMRSSSGEIQSDISARKGSPVKPSVYQDAPTPDETDPCPVLTGASLRMIDVNIVPPGAPVKVEETAAPSLKRGHPTRATDGPSSKRATRMTVMGLVEGRENAVRTQLGTDEGQIRRTRLRSRGSD